MPIQVSALIAGRPAPVTVQPSDTATVAIRRMVEHDYDQLPVVDARDRLLGLVSHGSLHRAAWTFECPVDELQVRDAVIDVDPLDEAAELSDLLERLRTAPAVLVVREGRLVGILTDFDTTEHLRRSAEDWMSVRDVEVTLRDLLRDSFLDADGTLKLDELRALIRKRAGQGNKEKFQKAVRAVLAAAPEGAAPYDAARVEAAWYEHMVGERIQADVEGLELQECVDLVAHKERWKDHFAHLFGPKPDKLRKLLKRVGKLRNEIAHHRKELSEDERALLHFCVQWLGRCKDSVAPRVAPDERPRAAEPGEPVAVESGPEAPPAAPEDEQDTSTGLYQPLARWFQGLSAEQESAVLSFQEIEALLGRPLPPSALVHRAWWANDTHSHVQARAWLQVGWRVASVNLSEGRVTFLRAGGKARACIEFFSAVINDLRGKLDAPTLYGSPHGGTWHWIAPLLPGRPAAGWLGLSFARGGRLRVEVYIDTSDRDRNKALFDLLHASRAALEAQAGAPLSWERLDQRRASRVALYHGARLSEATGALDEARAWAVQTILRVYPVFQQALVRARDELALPA